MESNSLLIGNNLCKANDLLEVISIDKAFDMITDPTNEFKAFTERLRNLNLLDPQQYKKLKKQLPYLVCGFFEPRFRSLSNFTYIEHFVIDIDHVCNQFLGDIEELKQKVTNDQRVKMAYVSPSGDGLKVFFQLNERCYDSAKFSMFYREFTREFSVEYGLEGMTDYCCCDSTRACFLSYDSNAYYCENCDTINWKSYLDAIHGNEIIPFLKEINNDISKKGDFTMEETEVQPIDDETFDFIKKRLNPKLAEREQRKKNIFVPQELECIIGKLTTFLSDNELEVLCIKDINYGKQIKVKHVHIVGEVNLFFGKYGFNTVESMKNGTNIEFNHLLKLLIDSFLLDKRLIA